MTLAVPIFDTFGDVQMVLQCPGLIDKVARDEAKLAVEILRAGERLNAIFGVSSIRPRNSRRRSLTPQPMRQLRAGRGNLPADWP